MGLFNPPASAIKGVQRGVIAQGATTNTATITSVNTAKTVVISAGQSMGGGQSSASTPGLQTNFSYLTLTNATTVTIDNNHTDSTLNGGQMPFQTLEAN